jgi:hypothetical protein
MEKNPEPRRHEHVRFASASKEMGYHELVGDE